MEGRARYNDVELAEFKQLIEEKLKLATREYDQLMDSLMNRGSNDVVDTSPTYKTLEEGSAVQSKEEMTNMAARQLKFIQGLQSALVRIDNKTYGICRVTGKLIPKERLRAVPPQALRGRCKRRKIKSESPADEQLETIERNDGTQPFVRIRFTFSPVCPHFVVDVRRYYPHCLDPRSTYKVQGQDRNAALPVARCDELV